MQRAVGPVRPRVQRFGGPFVIKGDDSHRECGVAFPTDLHAFNDLFDELLGRVRLLMDVRPRQVERAREAVGSIHDQYCNR